MFLTSSTLGLTERHAFELRKPLVRSPSFFPGRRGSLPMWWTDIAYAHISIFKQTNLLSCSFFCEDFKQKSPCSKNLRKKKKNLGDEHSPSGRSAPDAETRPFMTRQWPANSALSEAQGPPSRSCSGRQVHYSLLQPS